MRRLGAAVRAALRSRGLEGDRGTTLTELLVTLLIFSMVVAATITMAVGFARTNAENISRQDQIDSARASVQSMSRALRTAVMPSQLTSTCVSYTQDAFVVGRDYAVQFYANLDNPGNSVGPSRVTYSIATSGADAGNLVEKVQRPDSNVPTASGYQYCDAEVSGASAACRARLTTRVLARGVQAGTPVFKYYDRSGNRMSPTTAGGTLTAAELARVLAVELVVSVQAPNATRADPTTYIQRITLPNAQAVLRQSEED